MKLESLVEFIFTHTSKNYYVCRVYPYMYRLRGQSSYIYIYKDHPNQYKNSHKLYDEMAHPVLSLMESQWKLRQHDQRFPIEGYTL